MKRETLIFNSLFVFFSLIMLFNVSIKKYSILYNPELRHMNVIYKNSSEIQSSVSIEKSIQYQ